MIFRWRVHQSGIAENKAIVERNHDLSAMRQVQLLGMSRGTGYFLPRPTSPPNIALMGRTDERYREHPLMGARVLRDQLQREVGSVGWCIIVTLMQRMGIEALAPLPGASKSALGHKIYSYLLKK